MNFKLATLAVIALPLALKSVVMTPREIPGDQGQVEFDEGGTICVRKAKPGKPGPKAGQSSREVDVPAAVEAFAKVRPGGDYGQWVASVNMWMATTRFSSRGWRDGTRAPTNSM